jgi:hypothetical protein
MVCNSCGAQNVSSATHCQSCGVPLKGNATVSAGMGPAPSNYLVQSILVTLCCCLPFGIPAIVFASRVDGAVRSGDMAAAQLASASAKKWCWIGFISGLVVWGLSVLIYILFVLLLVGAAVQDQAH